MSADTRVPTLPPAPAHVDVTIDGHVRRLQVLNRVFLEGVAMEVGTHGHRVGCGDHSWTPPVWVDWYPQAGVLVVGCVVCRGLLGVLRPAADA